MPHRPYTYAELTHWRRYGAFFPARLRDAALPREERWAFRDLDVHLDRYDVPDAPATVVFLHGAGGCGRVFWPFGAALAAHGYAGVFPDMPGYGLTRTPPGPFDFALWVDLVAALVAREAAAGRPVVLFGASLGGPLAYHVAARSPHVAGLAATMLADPRDAATRARFVGVDALAPVAPVLLDALAPVLDGVAPPIAWLTRMDLIANDPGFVAALKADPHAAGGSVPLRFIRTMLAAVPAVEPEAFDRVPVLLVHPAEDRWTDVAISRPFFDRIAGEKTLVMLEGAGHAPVEEPGATQLEDAMLAFLGRIVAAG
jgi:alpha-beta hydrolase superfamily lysophospholipase